jgi:hypothetical protein
MRFARSANCRDRARTLKFLRVAESFAVSAGAPDEAEVL